MRQVALVALASAVTTVAIGTPRCNATAAAWAALATWCTPRTASRRSGSLPHGESIRNVARSSASSRTSDVRTSAPAPKPTVSTGAGLRRRSVSR